ncbi:Protein transport protein S9 plasma membrane t-SNARE [Tulasnella sp. 417]|nr:Protein transport protein S9 plasma membrane t-SNARE [Tulasnella sp. 417]
MSWLKKEDAPKIPEPASSLSQPNVLRRGDRDPSPNPPSYRTSNANTYNRSRDGDPYAAYLKSGGYNNPPPGNYQAGQDRYGRNGGVSDPYSRAGAGNVDADRNEIFAGTTQNNPLARIASRPGLERVAVVASAIQAYTRQLKNDLLQSTRNDPRLAREAEETARLTLNKLGDQSEKIASTERHLDQSKANTTRAEDRTSEIKQLNRSNFISVLTSDKEGNRRRQETKNAARRAEEQEERERTMRDLRDAPICVVRPVTYGMDDDDRGEGSGRMITAQQMKQRHRHRFEHTTDEEDEEDLFEDEIGGNPNQIGDVDKRFYALAKAKVDSENQRLAWVNKRLRELHARDAGLPRAHS